MQRRALFAITLLLIPAAIASCGARQDARLLMTFDVTDLPKEPSPAPSPEPETAPPPPPEVVPPPEKPPDPAEQIARRIRGLNEQLQPIRFETGRWEITPEGSLAIEANARVLRDAGLFTATVEGHTDERGSDRYNYVLGIYRAKAVKDRLRSLGFDPSRFVLLSHGKSRPAAAGSEPDALARNRRVEILVRTIS